MPIEQEQASKRSVSMVVIGLLIGLGVGAVAAWALADDPVADQASGLSTLPPVVSVPESPEATEAFMAAWERSRRETYLTVSNWHRVTAQGAQATEVRVFAQRMPDRIRSGANHRGGRIGDFRYTCDRMPPPEEDLAETETPEDLDDSDSPASDGPETDGGEVDFPEQEIGCFRSPIDPEAEPAVDVEAMVAEEVELMWRHVEGRRPLYRVGQVDDCFHLRLDRLMVVPPYGYRTKFCFDAETGAVSSLEVRRAEGTDTEELLWVTTDVTDDDLFAIVEGTFDASPPR